MTKKKTLKKCRKIHAIRRFKQRFGIDISSQDYKTIINIIKKREAKFIEKQSNTKTLWQLEYLGQEFVCVYSDSTKNILTFLKIDEEYVSDNPLKKM